MQQLLYFLVGFSISAICILLYQYSWPHKNSRDARYRKGIIITQIAILAWSVLAGMVSQGGEAMLMSCLGAVPMMIAVVFLDQNRRLELDKESQSSIETSI